MGNMLSSNEETLDDKLNTQLIHIVDEYQKMDLNMVYIAIFEIKTAHVQHGRHSNHTSALPGLDGMTSPASMSYAHPVTHGDSHSYNPGYPGSNHVTRSQHASMQIQNHSQSHSAIDPELHHNHSMARSNVKQKTKLEINRITELDNPMISLYQHKKRQIEREFTNDAEQEQQLKDLRRKHGFDAEDPPNTTFTKFPSLSSLTPMKLKGTVNGGVDEKENLLQESNGKTPTAKESISSAMSNEQSIKDVLKTNDIISSVRSLGDTTNKLCEILEKAKKIRARVIHIRGNKQTIFSYYLIGEEEDPTFILVSYARSKSDILEFMEWIKIQTKLEKLESNLREITALLESADQTIDNQRRRE